MNEPQDNHALSCPNCGLPMLYYRSEDPPGTPNPEPSIWSCPDCTYEEEAR